MLPPLPETPVFPVYGLGPRFDGFRWLTLWNDPRYLWTITLGHGHPEAGEYILVTTERESHSADDRQAPVSPLLWHVATVAAMSLTESAQGDRASRRAALDEEFANIELAGSGAVVLHGWDESEMRADDTRVTAHTRTIGNSAATVVDLPPVAVMIQGPAARRHEWSQIVNVSQRLDDYGRLPATT